MQTKNYTPKANKKASSNEPKQDKFIERILENLDKVKESDWEMYTNLEAVYPVNRFNSNIYLIYRK